MHKSGGDYGALAGHRRRSTSQVPYIDNAGIDATGQTVMVYRLLSNPADRVFLQTNPDGMYMRYNGVTIMAHQADVEQLAGRRLAGAVEGGRAARQQRQVHARRTARAAWRGTFGRDAAGPNDFVNSDGLLIGDRPVVAKAQLIYRFPWGIMVAGNLQHQTGRFYTRAVRVAGLGFPAAPQINMEAEHRRPARAGRQPDRRARPEGVHAEPVACASTCSSTRST